MLIDKKLVVEAKKTLGEEAAEIISQELEIENFDTKNLKGCCPFHSESTPSFVWNSEENYFKCFGCGKVYGIIDHYMLHDRLTYLEAIEKLFYKTNTKFLFGEKGVKTKKDYKYPHFEHIEDRSVVEKYALNRHISKETLDWANIQQDNEGNMMFPYYDTNDVLCLVKYRPARRVEKTENKMWCQKNSDTTPLLFNMNKTDFTNGPLIIVEGELDCLSIIESNYKNVVSVPFGSNNFSWIEQNFEFLEKFDNLIVWSDNDEPGIAMRREVISRLGSWRTKFVDLDKQITKEDGKKIKLKDANELLFYTDKETVLSYIANAQEIPITGIEDLASVDDFDIEKAQGLFSGIEPIDKTVYKFLMGSVVIVTGLRGAGKSSFLNQCFICEPLHQGLDTFVFSGELSPSVLKSWVEMVMMGREKIIMKNEFIHVLDKDSLKIMREWYKGRIWVYNDDSNKSEIILEKAISVVRKFGVKVILLDNLTTIDLSANDTNALEKQKDFVVRLIQLAKLYNILIVLVVHPKKLQTGQELNTDDVYGSGSITNLAQYIISVKRFTKKEKAGERDGRGKIKAGKEPIQEDVEVNILKNRYTGKLDAVRLFFDYNSYRFFSKREELFKRFKWDTSTKPIPTLESTDKRFDQPDFMKG